MPDYQIRLRGGWESPGFDGGPRVGRVTLPLPGPPVGPGRIQFARSFQSPPLDRAAESLWLRLQTVPGLVAVHLNGRELSRAPFVEGTLLLALDEAVPGRNRLVLDVEPPARLPDPGSPWGEVALVIRRLGESAVPGRSGPSGDADAGELLGGPGTGL